MRYAIETLKALALRGGRSDFISVSTSDLGAELGVSQQTASNRLVAMERSGEIKRRRGVKGQEIMVTKSGLALLAKEFSDYQIIFVTPAPICITGTVDSGLGEGQYYINKPGYRHQIESKVGFIPFHGTLNLRVTDKEMSKLSMVPMESRIPIGSFQADGRTYGEAECIPVCILDRKGAIIIPKRSHHSGILEIISDVHLRSMFGLKDGDSIQISVVRY